MSETYEWIPTQTAPRDYPAFVVAGFIRPQDSAPVSIPDERIANGGWGQSGSIQLIEPMLKPIPTDLGIVWYGLIERQGWKALISLPVEVIRSWFRSGAPTPDGLPEPFGTVAIGVAPGGDVAVWLRAGRVVRLAGMYRAERAEITVRDMAKDPAATEESFVQEMLAATLQADELARVRSVPVPFGRWRDFAVRYAWQPQVELEGTGDLLWVTGFDGECDWVDLTGKRPLASSALTSTRGVPSKLGLTWTAPSGARMSAEATLDPIEALQIFAAMSIKAAANPLLMLVHPADAGNNVEVLLASGEEVYRFNKVASLVWQR